jgi:ATP-dependent 26S proteasome regulatory subunit
MAKLKKLLEDISFETDIPKVNVKEVMESVSRYGMIGRKIYNENNVVNAAKQLAKIAEDAHSHVISETDNWFDRVSLKRNMKHMSEMVTDFKKTAVESHQLNQRLTTLYEDIGSILNRYYDIKEITEVDGSDYEGFFKGVLKKFGISSPGELTSDEEKKKFYDYVDKNWKGSNEAD